MVSIWTVFVIVKTADSLKHVELVLDAPFMVIVMVIFSNPELILCSEAQLREAHTEVPVWSSKAILPVQCTVVEVTAGSITFVWHACDLATVE